MKILEEDAQGRPKAVELSVMEQMQSATFERLLDRGFGIVAAADMATQRGCSRLFYEWLTK
jgi:hypothetical protein